MSKSGNGGGYDDLGCRSSKVSKNGCGDVRGVWKCSIGVNFGD